MSKKLSLLDQITPLAKNLTHRICSFDPIDNAVTGWKVRCSSNIYGRTRVLAFEAADPATKNSYLACALNPPKEPLVTALFLIPGGFHE